MLHKLYCWQILFFSYALNFINRCFGSLFWLLGVPIGSLFHKKWVPIGSLSQSLGVPISFRVSGVDVTSPPPSKDVGEAQKTFSGPRPVGRTASSSWHTFEDWGDSDKGAFFTKSRQWRRKSEERRAWWSWSMGPSPGWTCISSGGCDGDICKDPTLGTADPTLKSEEGGEGEHWNVLQLLDRSFPLQQVLRAAHEVFLAEWLIRHEIYHSSLRLCSSNWWTKKRDPESRISKPLRCTCQSPTGSSSLGTCRARHRLARRTVGKFFLPFLIWLMI